jgi:hypothetical protein
MYNINMKPSSQRIDPFSNSRVERILLVALLTALTGIVLIQTNPATNPPSRDGGIFAYSGSEILNGKLMYVDIVDNKPPGIYYLNAFALLLTGGSRWGIWLVEFLFLFSSVLLSYFLLVRQWGKFAALVGTLLWLSGLRTTLFGGNYTEEYSLFFSFLALSFFWQKIQRPTIKGLDFLIGLTGGMSFLFRPNNIGIHLSIGLTILLTGILNKSIWQAIKRLLLLGLGVLLPLALMLIYFAWRGGLLALLEAVFVYNFTYTGSHLNLSSTLRASFIFLNIGLLFALIGYLLLIVGIARQGLKTVAAWYYLLLVGFPMEIILSALSGRAYNHYFICWLPMISLLIAFAFSSIWKWVNLNPISRPSITYGVLLLIILIVDWQGLGIYSHAAIDLFTGKRPIEYLDPVSAYIREHTKPQDKVLIWGAQAGINFTAGRESPTSYFLYPMFIPSNLSIQLEDRFLADIQSHPPSMIVDAYYFATGDEIWPSIDPVKRFEQLRTTNQDSRVYTAPNIEQVFEFIDQHYHLEKKISLTSIYRLNP